MNKIKSAQQGFTLIEVLVALTLMALVSLIAWRGLDTVQSLGEQLDGRAEDTLSIVRVLTQIERDILLHATEDVLPQAAAQTPSTASSRALPAGIVWAPDSGLYIVRSASGGRWLQLHWFLKDGSLFRASGAPSYALPLPAADSAVAVLSNVNAFTLRIWVAGQGWIQPPQEKDTNQTGGTFAVKATGLEIVFSRGSSQAAKPYRKVVVLP